MNIGNKLKTLRTKRALDPLSMAEHLGISETTYRRYERNESVPDLNMLEKIAKVHEIDLVELLSDDKYVFNQHNKKGDNNGLVINQLSEKLIEQYEIRLKEKDEIISELKNRLTKLEN